MKSISRLSFLRFVAIAAVLCFGLRAYAEEPRAELVHAYHLLKTADHDYDGHRLAAMGEVEAAGHELGLDLGGDVSDRERQWKSDKHLAEARRILRHAYNTMEARDRDRVAGHLEKAIKEIGDALAVK